MTYTEQKYNYKGRRNFSKIVKLRNQHWKWFLYEKSSNTALFVFDHNFPAAIYLLTNQIAGN